MSIMRDDVGIVDGRKPICGVMMVCVGVIVFVVVVVAEVPIM